MPCISSVAVSFCSAIRALQKYSARGLFYDNKRVFIAASVASWFMGRHSIFLSESSFQLADFSAFLLIQNLYNLSGFPVNQGILSLLVGYLDIPGPCGHCALRADVLHVLASVFLERCLSAKSAGGLLGVFLIRGHVSLSKSGFGCGGRFGMRLSRGAMMDLDH